MGIEVPDRNREPARYRVTGMDCASCAGKIEKAARSVDGIDQVKVSTASQIMTVAASDPSAQLPEVERAVTAIGYKLDRIPADAEPGAATAQLSETATHTTPRYRRALLIVVLLNVGYGVVEMVGGFISRSQALKADALDFLGDGLITYLGVLAIGWTITWRARAALLQGLFLGALGVGVLVATAYRVVSETQPEAEVMGLLGGIALGVNLLAAVVLLPHRAGDANVRAVWLFSRNDALGNIAVVVAAGLVFWTKSPWPDLVVAGIIAGLFLHSSWSIVRDARQDLRHAPGGSAPGHPRDDGADLR